MIQNLFSSVKSTTETSRYKISFKVSGMRIQLEAEVVFIQEITANWMGQNGVAWQ